MTPEELRESVSYTCEWCKTEAPHNHNVSLDSKQVLALADELEGLQKDVERLSVALSEHNDEMGEAIELLRISRDQVEALENKYKADIGPARAKVEELRDYNHNQFMLATTKIDELRTQLAQEQDAREDFERRLRVAESKLKQEQEAHSRIQAKLTDTEAALYAINSGEYAAGTMDVLNENLEVHRKLSTYTDVLREAEKALILGKFQRPGGPFDISTGGRTAEAALSRIRALELGEEKPAEEPKG